MEIGLLTSIWVSAWPHIILVWLGLWDKAGNSNPPNTRRGTHVACGTTDAFSILGGNYIHGLLLGIYLMPSKVPSTSGVSKTTEDKIPAFEEFIIFLGWQDVHMRDT